MSYPVQLQLQAPREIANWRPLVHWLLALPHLFIANVLNNLAGVLTVISWVIIVVTGRLPEGIARLQCLILRYEARTYSYVLCLREPYPAFEFAMTFEDPGADLLRVDVTPQLEGRNRLTVGLRFIWIIPAIVVALVLGLVGAFAVVAGFVAVLFTGRWPEGLHRFVVAVFRLVVRVNAYGRLLVDDYPPMTLADDAGR